MLFSPFNSLLFLEMTKSDRYQTLSTPSGYRDLERRVFLIIGLSLNGVKVIISKCSDQ